MITLYDLAYTLDILLRAIDRHNREKTQESWQDVLAVSEMGQYHLKLVYPEEPEL